MTPNRKVGRPIPRDRDKTNEATKPWLKLGIKRRAWYYRQAKPARALNK